MNLGKISAGTFLVVFTCGIILGFVLVGAGNGIKSNVSDSGGGIEIAVGFMIIGAGYLVIAGSVLWAAATAIVAAIAILVRWVGAKYRGQNEATTTAGQKISNQNPNSDSKEFQGPDDD
jgi:hypothetical protein